MADRSEPESWHLDKKVPIALIGVALIQFGGFIWFASDSNTRLGIVEKRLEATAPQSDRLTRVETRVEIIQSDVKDIKSDLKALLNRSHPPGATP
jgi:hypothetical protein